MKDPKVSTVMTKEEISKAVRRISHEILERNPSKENIAVIGIKNRGMYLAERITRELEKLTGKPVETGALDITLYRDDLSGSLTQPVVESTDITFDMSGRIVILVDDVLYTGRTVRCALEESIDFGRLKMIQLAVLVDRGHREFPIRPDYVGKNVPTAENDTIEVHLSEADDGESVTLVSARQS